MGKKCIVLMMNGKKIATTYNVKKNGHVILFFIQFLFYLFHIYIAKKDIPN